MASPCPGGEGGCSSDVISGGSVRERRGREGQHRSGTATSRRHRSQTAAWTSAGLRWVSPPSAAASVGKNVPHRSFRARARDLCGRAALNPSPQRDSRLPTPQTSRSRSERKAERGSLFGAVHFQPSFRLSACAANQRALADPERARDVSLSPIDTPRIRDDRESECRTLPIAPRESRALHRQSPSERWRTFPFCGTLRRDRRRH